MLYKVNNTTLELDMVHDLNSWAYDMLTDAGFDFVTRDHALSQYCVMQLRVLEPKPRKVMISREFVVPDEDKAKTGYECFLSAVEKGDNLIPFMSCSILDASFKDKMIFDWGLYHFHLSTERCEKDPRFMERSKHLLIAYVDPVHDDPIYFLQIRDHVSSVWTEQELVRILADNWPEVMENKRVKGVDALTENITDQDYRQLRRANINTFVDLHDGRVYMGANYGLSSAGTSVRASRQCDIYVREAQLFQEAMGSIADTIGEAINSKLHELRDNFKLKMIKPGDRDYLFEVEGFNCLLRVAERDGKLWCYVGDTEAHLREGA